MKKNTLLIAVLAGSLFSTLASAQEAAPVPYYGTPQMDPAMYLGFHSHTGFYLSMGAGFGGINFEDNLPPDDYKISGPITDFDFKIGGAVIPNQLILSGDIVESIALNPEVSDNGTDEGQANGSSLSIVILGLGVTHYFMPLNAFISGTAGFGRFVVQDGAGDQAASNGGLGIQLKAGKEWWVSPRWGLGVSVSYIHLGVSQTEYNQDDALETETITGNSIALMFNATHD